MSDQNAQEPTMEEILASIRRIISEDEPPASADPVAQEPEPEPEPAAEPEPEPAAEPPHAEEPEHDDVLELTDRVPEPEPAPVETLGDLELHAPAPEPEPAPVAAAAPEPEPAPAPPSGLLSDTAANAASSAFGRLAQSVAMPTSGQSLDDVVRELLRPLLKAWLDEHLPEIVQAKVAEEVERVSRRR